MIKIVTKEDFYMFENKMNAVEFSISDDAILECFHQFIDDYDDEEIDVYGYFDTKNDLIGLIRFSEEPMDYLFNNLQNSASSSITLIGALLVHPRYRRKGIGKRLVKFAISRARTEDIVTDPVDLEASNFFKYNGFSHDNKFGDFDGWLLYISKPSLQI